MSKYTQAETSKDRKHASNQRARWRFSRRGRGHRTTTACRTSASIRGRRLTDRKLSGFSPGQIFIQTEDWPKWIQRFERFHKATRLDKGSGENQVNTLIYTMGEQADDVFISSELTTEQEKNCDKVKEKFENYLRKEMLSSSKRNLIHETSKKEGRWTVSLQSCMASRDTAISER